MHKNNQPRAVFLVGFMGAGKTSVGKTLAERLGWSFLDLDDRIEQRERRTVKEIFAHPGEAAFRRAETAALRQVLTELTADAPRVVALGGGAFVQPENAALLAESGEPVVFLDAPVEVLRDRCRDAGAARPLFQDEAAFRALYEARRPHYLRAGVHVDTTERSIDAVAMHIAALLALQKTRLPK